MVYDAYVEGEPESRGRDDTESTHFTPCQRDSSLDPDDETGEIRCVWNVPEIDFLGFYSMFVLGIVRHPRGERDRLVENYDEWALQCPHNGLCQRVEARIILSDVGN